MKVHLYIALRYLFAKKSHNVINVISAISAAGIAIGTAALILILSVYNGFDRIIEDNMSDLDPDVLVTPAEGRTFHADDSLFDRIYGFPEVKRASSVLQDNVFLSYDGKQSVATAKGVDFTYGEDSPIAGHLVEGHFSRYEGDVPLASLGAGLAYELGVHVRFLDKVRIFYPDASGRTSLLGPAASMRSISLRPGSIFSISSEVDNSMIIMPLEELQGLLGLGEDEVSGIEIRTGIPVGKAFVRKLADSLGDACVIKTRRELNPSLYRMMRYEKFAIFLILIFVVIIVAFNIFGSMSMLMIEKRDDMQTLRAMGATEGLVKKIFLYEGWLISMIGLATGLAAGVVLALLQQHLGLIRMPGNFFIEAYPVVLQWSDVLWTTIGVSLIGLVIARAAVRGK